MTIASAYLDHLAALQKVADGYAQLSQSHAVISRVQVVFVTDSELPWRLIETVPFEHPRSRIMHSFRTIEKLRVCLLERLVWARADIALAGRVGSGREPVFVANGISLETRRLALRARLCRTQADTSREVSRMF